MYFFRSLQKELFINVTQFILDIQCVVKRPPLPSPSIKKEKEILNLDWQRKKSRETIMIFMINHFMVVEMQ